MYIQSLQKETQTLLNDFWGVKIIEFQNDSISVALSIHKTFTAEFRQRHDFEFRFGIENLKS